VEPAVELHHQAEGLVGDIGELVVHPALTGAPWEIVTAFDVAQRAVYDCGRGGCGGIVE
jgi:hypothetical protein